jgi:prevent-host-death family protein
VRSIDVRELRRRTSRYLGEVERGNPIEVTDHGRPVARLVPIPWSSDADTLLLTGQLSPAAGDVLELGEPLEPVTGVPLPSAELAAMRRSAVSPPGPISAHRRS